MRTLAILIIVLLFHASGFIALMFAGCAPKNHISHPYAWQDLSGHSDQHIAFDEEID